MDTLPELLARHPDAVALIDRGRHITARELDLESQRVAQGLRALGINEGDRVALWLPNVPAWLACFFGCARIGAIAVAVNTRFRVSELQDILGRSGAKVLIVWAAFRGIDFKGILEQIDPPALCALDTIVAYTEGDESAPATVAQRRVINYDELIRNRSRPSCASTLVPAQAGISQRNASEHSDADDSAHMNRARPDSGVLLFTTSGTTRAPKFVLHNQRALTVHADDVARAFGYDAPDAVILLTIPLCGTFGLTNALAAIAAGRPAVMMPTFEAQMAANLIRQRAVTHFPAAGDVVAQLLAISSEPRPYPRVRLVIGARPGQAAPAEARGLCLVGVYGMSEVQAMVSRHSESDPPEIRERGGGLLIAAGAAVRARDTETGEILPHERSGELEFRMPSQMVCYFENEEATRAALTEDGFVRSGDLGYTVPGGFVFQARMGDALRLSGFMVNPLEIEGILNSHRSVAASQVVGVEGTRGLYAVAFVIARNGSTVDERAVITHCAQRIAAFKVPKRVFVVDEFPVTHSANGTKVQKAKLREMATELLSREKRSSPCSAGGA